MMPRWSGVPPEDGGRQRGHADRVGAETGGQDEGDGFRGELACEVGLNDVLGRVVAVLAPRPVLTGGGDPGVRVELAAGIAESEVA